MNKYISRGLKKTAQIEEPAVPTAVTEQQVSPPITETPIEQTRPVGEQTQTETTPEPAPPTNENTEDAA